MENPVISAASPRSDRAACNAGCHCAASTTHFSGPSDWLLEATSTNQRIFLLKLSAVRGTGWTRRRPSQQET